MNKFITCFLLACIGHVGCFAQYNNPANNVWAMSNYCGIDFNGMSPVPITTSAHPLSGNLAGEGCASIADGNGNLMFYTDGMSIWNDIGNVMPNGNNIDGEGSAQSMTQNSVIVPFPNNPQLYYLFILNQYTGGNNVTCRIVNMALDNGRGDIDTANSLDGLKIDSLLSEKMIAVSGCNNDFWLILKPGGNPASQRYHTFHITASGLNTNAIVSFVNSPPNAASQIGVIKINEQRNKIVECNPGLMIRDFNPNTGVVSNGTQIDEMVNTYYGAAFSPDGTKVYANIGGTYQFDLTASNITASKTLVGAGGNVVDLKLGPDGKIYLPAFTPATPDSYMARINFPDNAGSACGYEVFVPTLHFQGTSIKSGGAMPNEVWMPFTGGTTNGHLVKDTVICNYSPAIVIHATSGQTAYQWDNGSTDTLRNIVQPGTYWVRYTDQFCNHQVDTYKISNTLTPALSIVQNGYTLSTTETYATYQWYKGDTLLLDSTHQSLTISSNGLYSVKVTNADGCVDSASIHISNYTSIHDMERSLDIKIYPNPSCSVIKIDSKQQVRVALFSIDGRCMFTPAVRSFMDVSGLARGIYFIKIWDSNLVLLRVEKILKN